MYFAIIGDIINSKKIQDREAFQQRLNDVLDQLNTDYRDVIASQFFITLGDEFQAILHRTAPVFQIIDVLISRLSPISVRFGLGFGDIKTSINPEMSIGADGPAFWYAREAIVELHQKNDYGDTLLTFKSENMKKNQVMNALISSGDAIKASWRASQMEVFNGLLELGIYDEHFDHQQLANKLSINPSALSKRLKSSHLKVYLRSRKLAQNFAVS
ncbi:hypothetical protein HMPREF9318_00400 [Streptococcus urinalis FB127-CNA-2]|uniref:SatD protein n=1 Tax=Streptococcus urinalis 2285-97 TaxID=764291 RepID=G5KFZ2_9STRE|nr:SatD family protein [Streptococcus urinalis]EHJ56542.1 SatD protein [Streptococcus urinalis 2285-97]EKS22202.1 hypothetical protein HMPREF9318_00400 [Streptococcus urinalis FB127-CNA-2]VEF32014.1 secretion and acid tolerance protein SatD [Streptococcus urinalis]